MYGALNNIEGPLGTKICYRLLFDSSNNSKSIFLISQNEKIYVDLVNAFKYHWKWIWKEKTVNIPTY